MKYDKIVKAIFIERPNRFIARVKIDGAEEVELVHVKNTGRCRELLLPGAEVILEDCIEKNPNRKTRYDLIAVKKNKIWVNIDSQAPNKVVKEWLMTQGMIILNQSIPLEIAGWISIWKKESKNI